MKSLPLAVRFWQKVDQRGPDECWPWTAALNEHGYGVIGRGGRGAGMGKAHRVSWELHFGKIPDGLAVCHRCDNPRCVNPKHLFIATQRENMADCRRKGRIGTKTTGFAPILNEEKARFIRDAAAIGFSRARLARVFDVERTTIIKIVHGERWRDA